jgi:adenine-specific DNA-methyltransferase
LKSIAQNQALDPIFEKWEPILAEKLAALNKALKTFITKDLRTHLLTKLEAKSKREGKKAVTDADRRRWLLPPANREGKPYTTVDNDFAGWYDWEVPFDTDPDWPGPLQDALTEYRKAWRSKMDEVNACIAARADQEELVDQPFLDKSRVRVSGPFTMEGVIPAEESIEDEPEAEAQTPIAGAPEGLETFEGEGPLETEAQNAEAYLDRMIRYLREDGVRFPDNKVVKFTSLEALADGTILHAKGIWNGGKDERRVAVMFGPQYGPLVAAMVEEGIRFAARRGYDDLIFAAFSFDGAAQAVIQEDPDPKVRIHMAQIRPDVNMGDLLKTTVSSQLFTVSGSPRTRLEKQDDGQFVVHMEGVDIYDPVTNSVRSTGAEKVAAWFLDSDYDGKCFCVCQAFFPDKSAWDRLARALGGTLDEAAFDKFSGTVSLPFPAGKHKRVAVKVIDPRGNEVLTVRRLDTKYD